MSERYALLVSPSTSRVYAQSASALARAELAAVSESCLGGTVFDIREDILGSTPYITFSVSELSELALAWLSNLAATFALFRREGELLYPLDLARWDKLDSDILTIPKYAGKTNESFTKLLLNLTLAASAFGSEPERPLTVLDPLCGRGTTLSQAATYGFHASGVELDKKDFEAYSLFIQRWVKDKRFKHDATLGHTKGHPKLDLTFGLDKTRYKAGDVLRLCYVNADTHAIAQAFQPRSFDLIVTDAPYGVQHGAHRGEELRRGPLELLESAIPVWRGVLRPGGAMGISWNTRVTSRDSLARILSGAGLKPCDSPAFRSFAHRVDSSIERDLIVARAQQS